ncbi:MAG: PspC domain-containing protein [Spirochaetes bacterium]|nr:PspC domain-containing protein [Spirochaetota bacterium]NLJ05981.1 PspC domain-containing protein [Exilispira sp.]MBP8991813.1 PspC domain-containing protein [Spirochaetota bacterium]HNV44277.1 PspC domain-containing protein [Exilispira sp.]HOV45797.1 PspC domain-containing protein [Exilispira sp.]
MSTKQLYRSKTNKIIAGICGGIGEYTNVDPTIIRVFAVFLIIITGVVPGLLTYFIAMFIIPEKSDVTKEE